MIGEVEMKSRCKLDWKPYEYKDDTGWPYARPGADEFRHKEGILDDPFLESEPVFPESPNSYKLDCESGLAHFDCFTDARSVCDAFCRHQCWEYFSSNMTQVKLAETMTKHGAKGCAYRLQEIVELKAKACRRELTYSFRGGKQQVLTEKATIYLIEPDWNSVTLANYKRLRKVALTLPLRSRFTFNETIPRDFGNFIRATDLTDVGNCTVNPGRLPPFYTELYSESLYRMSFGAVYSWEHFSDGAKGKNLATALQSGVYTYDITYLLRPSALAPLGGLPKQFVIWWPGVQPKLIGQDNEGQSSDLPTLKIIFSLPPTRYFTSQGAFNIEDEYCRLRRKDF